MGMQSTTKQQKIRPVISYLIQKSRSHGTAHHLPLMLLRLIRGHVDISVRKYATENISEEIGTIKVIQPSCHDILTLPEITQNHPRAAEWTNKQLDDWRVEMRTLGRHPRKYLLCLYDMAYHGWNISK